jgi:hypothetical protein
MSAAIRQSTFLGFLYAFTHLLRKIVQSSAFSLLKKEIAHCLLLIARYFAGRLLPDPYPRNSIGDAQWAMGNEIR